MSPRPLRREPLALAALAALAVSLSPAAHPAEENKENRDILFARALIDRGFGIVAEGVIERSLAAPGTSEVDKERFQVLRLMLSLRNASRSGAGGRDEAFKEAFAALDAVVGQDGKVKAGGQAASDLGEFLLEGSTTVAEEARSESTPEKAAEFRKRAVAMVEAAEKIFEARLEAARSKASAPSKSGEEEAEDDGGPRVSREEMEAAYNLARARMQRGKVLDAKGEREQAFKEAIRNLEDFQATYADTLLVYQSAILAGQCWNEMENYSKAMDSFEGSVQLIEQFREDGGGPIKVDNVVAADIIQRGLYLKSQAANRAQKYSDGLLSVKRAFDIFPEITRRPIGLALRVEKGRALIKLGKAEEARGVLQEVDKDDPDGPMGADARKLLGEIVSVLKIKGERDLAPIMIDLIDRGRYMDAIETCRRIIAQLDGLPDAERADKVPAILIWLGKIYSLKEVKRFQEAAIAFEELCERFPGHKLAPEAAYQAVKARLLANIAAPSKLDQDRFEDDLRRLQEKYKGSEQAGRAQFIQADIKFEQGEYEEAAKIYLGVPKSAGQFWDNALFQAGLCWWNLAVRSKTIAAARPYYEKAEKVFKEVEALAGQSEGLDADRVQNRIKLKVTARVKLADIESSFALKKYKEALAVIEACDKEDRPTPDETVLLLMSRVRAQAALDDPRKAEESLQLLKRKQPASRIIPQLAREVAGSFDRLADEARKKGPEGEKEYRALISKALEHYAEWLDESNRLKAAVSPTLLMGTPAKPPAPARPGIANRAHAIALELTGLPEKKDSFSDCLGRADIPRAEWERAVKFLEAAKPPKSDDWLPPTNIGRAYGFLGEWPKARAALEEALVWGGLLAATGEMKPAPRPEALEKAPDLLDIFIDLGFAELIPARKGGLARAQSIFDNAFKLAQRDTCAFWKCRYGYIWAEFKEGNYDRAQSFMNSTKRAPEWETGDACGLKEQFNALEKEIQAKSPAGASAGGAPASGGETSPGDSPGTADSEDPK